MVKNWNEFFKEAERLGVPKELCEAEKCLGIQNQAYIIGLSGKIASGKDYVAEKIIEQWPNTTQISFAAALKNEVTEIIKICQDSKNKKTARALVQKTQQVTKSQSSRIINVLYTESKENTALSSWDKNKVIREALQLWGSGIRRLMDEEYWNRKAILKTIEAFQEGRSVIITDVRFLSEAQNLAKLNIPIIRIDALETVRLKRMQKRDQNAVSKEQLNHAGETELDGWEGFLVRLNNNEEKDEAVLKTLELIKSQSFGF